MLVAEGDRLQGQDRFTRLVHRLNLFLEALGRNDRAEMTVRIDNDSNSSGYNNSANTGNKGVALRSFGADTDATGFACYPRVTDIDIVTAGGEITAGMKAERNVEVAGRVISQRIETRWPSYRCRWCYARALDRRWPC